MPPMALYRCYFLDGDDRIRERTDIEADALGAAVDRALELLRARPEGHSIEIWQGAQRVYPESAFKHRARR
jgi:hypothetical protein